ncbi:MAG: cysteine synthase A [bacterium]|nr:cysteine synthase A [bacterium]
MAIAENILDLIGNTPLVKLHHLFRPNSATVYAKLEFQNPGGSVKDRICIAMLEEAEKRGLIKPGSTIVEPTSGNTGIGLALVAAVKKYRLILTMPESMSEERIKMLKLYGAEVILTPAKDGMLGAIAKAEEIIANTPGAFMPQQFKNPANPAIHRKTTGPEIFKALKGNLDAVVIGVGTGGTLTGIAEFLKKKKPAIKIIAVEPASSAVLSGKKAGPHTIQGIGAGFIPEVLNPKVIDEIVCINDTEAYQMAKRLATEEGILAGISSGAAVAAASKIAEQLGQGKIVVVILPDRGERYLSVAEFS